MKPRRLFRLLMALLPAELRRDAGAEIERTYEAMWKDEVTSGQISPGHFWLRALLDFTRACLPMRSVPGEGRAPTRRTRMSGLVRDLRFGFRQIARQPMFSLAVISLVAIGIAGNAAVFRVVNGLFLRPLPFEESERLVDIDLTAPEWNLDFVSVSVGEYRFWRDAEPRSLQSLAAFRQTGGNLSFADGAEWVDFVTATHTLDDVLGLEPIVGRFFSAEEDQPDAPRVALLTHRYWSERYQADPTAVGSTVILDGHEVSLIGVLPPEADFLDGAELWMPLREDAQSSFYLKSIGRLAEGATAVSAQAELRALRQPGVETGLLMSETLPVVASLRDRYLGESRLGSGLLFSAVAIVLLIACANIAGLMIARSASRTTEVSVRRALGAARSLLVRQLLLESLVLAVIGGALGTLIGLGASGPLVRLLAEGAPSWVRFDLDPALFGFTALATCGAALLFGLVPAVRTSSRVTHLSRGGTAAPARQRGLRILVAGQVALSVALLLGAAFAALDVRSLTRVDPGFNAENLVTWRMQLPSAKCPGPEEQARFVSAYRARLADLPEVENATVANLIPLTGHSGWFFSVEGAPTSADGGASEVVLRRLVTPGHIEMMGITLLQGRTLGPDDGGPDGQRVAVVNEAFVRSHIPSGIAPVGQRIRTGENSPWILIVGVSRDLRHYGVDEPMRPAVFEPFAAVPGPFLRVAIRSRGEGAFEAARRATAELDAGLALFDVKTMRERLDADLLPRRAASGVLSVFSLIAVLLGVAGLYGVISYGVTQRRREIGIRMALGAKADRLGRRVAADGILTALVGVVLGLVAGALLGRLVGETLLSVTVWDPRVYLGVGGGVLGVAALANWIPARRAARTQPMEALRAEG